MDVSLASDYYNPSLISNFPSGLRQVLQKSKKFKNKGGTNTNCRSADNVSGWYVSEKLDGERAIWDGKKLYSRAGNQILIPDFFRAELEDFPPCDGELFLGRGTFGNTGLFRKVKLLKDDIKKWREKVKYYVFDQYCPGGEIPFKDRYAQLITIYRKHMCERGLNRQNSCLRVLRQRLLPHDYHNASLRLDKMMNHVLLSGGEGLIIRNPESEYFKGRSSDILKYKPIRYAKSTIVGYKFDPCDHLISIKLKFQIDGLLSEMDRDLARLNMDLDPDSGDIWEDKFLLSVSSGLTRKHRQRITTDVIEKYFPLGSTIWFKYRGISFTGKPKYPYLILSPLES